MRPLSLLSRDCFTWLRLTIQSLLARKNMELSSRRSQSARERRMRTLPLGKWAYRNRFLPYFWLGGFTTMGLLQDLPERLPSGPENGADASVRVAYRWASEFRGTDVPGALGRAEGTPGFISVQKTEVWRSIRPQFRIPQRTKR